MFDMTREQLEKFLKKESDRVWKKRGGRADDLPDPQLTLPKEKRLEKLRHRYEMREKDRQKKKKARMKKATLISSCETMGVSPEN